MKALLWLFVVVGIAISSDASAQGIITGTVTEGQTGEALPGVNVAIVGTQQGSTTERDGRYTILNVAPGTYTLQASFVGYSTERVEAVEVRDEETITVDFTLQATDIGMGEVVVTALGIDREARALGYSVARVEPQEITTNRTPIQILN